ncbi:MAG: DUF3570 domain-containing protein [Pseudohongiellaceae bacterium]
MAATDEAGRRRALQALTAAAMLLPGVQAADAQTTSPGLSVQSSHYQEGRRRTASGLQPPPLTAWSLSARAEGAMPRGLQGALTLSQDSWSGATPVTVAPVAFGGNRAQLQQVGDRTVLSGASPLINGRLPLDADLRPLVDSGQGQLVPLDAAELVLSSASPEVRREATFRLGAATGRWRPSLGLGYSNEPDYRSRRLDIGSTVDFNQQRTTLTVAGHVSDDAVAARLEGDWLAYVTTSAFRDNIEREAGSVTLRGKRRARSLDFALTQVLNRRALLDIGVSLHDEDGLLENPYRAMSVLFVDTTQKTAGGPLTGDLRALLEQRPDHRRGRSASLHYVQHVGAVDASLHIDYDYSRDSWDVESQALELQWLQPWGDWLLAPRLRWYSQQAAWFHSDVLVSQQRFRSFARDESGREIWLDARDPSQRFFRSSDGRYLDATGRERDPALLDLTPQFQDFTAALLPAQFSSDPRLAGYGVQSAGLTVQRRLGDGLVLEAAFDRYRRASDLQFNGRGDSGYADFSYSLASLSLTLDLAGSPLSTGHTTGSSAGHEHVALSHDAAPAGVMYAHTPGSAGSWMGGYRLQQQGQMTMHMLDVVYHQSERFSLMLMPQFMTMDHAGTPHVHAGDSSRMPVSAYADTVVAGLWHRPTDGGLWQLTAGVGLPSRRTGATDLLPSLQYSTTASGWRWGLRLAASAALERQPVADTDPARSLEQSAWLSYPLTAASRLSLRLVHSKAHFRGSGTRQETAVALGLAGSVFALPVSLEWVERSASNGIETPMGPMAGGQLWLSWQLPL